MPPGKLAAQAGHAFLDSFLAASASDPARAAAYLADGHGTKVTLAARDADHLELLHQVALNTGLPCALITDSGHVMPGTRFDGSPVITALGLGPATREEVMHVVKRLPLIR